MRGLPGGSRSKIVKPPDVVTSFYDKHDDITYHVYAYRKLSVEEAVVAVQRAYRLTNLKKPPRGSALKIKYLGGYDE